MAVEQRPLLFKTSSYGQGMSTVVGGLALQVLMNPRIGLAGSHVSGVKDGATARHNTVHHMFGWLARRSQYENAPGGLVSLDVRLLRALLQLSRVYTFSVSELVGGSHSKHSDHYVGRAFDVNVIDGQGVSIKHPSYKNFMQDCRDLGATTVWGPPTKGHNTHIHAAWPAS